MCRFQIVKEKKLVTYSEKCGTGCEPVVGRAGTCPPSVPQAICLCSALQFLLLGLCFYFHYHFGLPIFQKCSGDMKSRLVQGRPCLSLILLSDFKVSSNLIYISHSYDALCYVMSCEVGRTGVYYPDFGDRDTDRGSGTRRVLSSEGFCVWCR